MNENQTQTADIVKEEQLLITKYRYLRSQDYFPCAQGQFAKLAITIATDLDTDEEGFTFCYWSVAFKAPSDQFNKKEARIAVAENDGDPLKSGVLPLGYKYDHNEIVGKILMTLLINDVVLTKHYYTFIRCLLKEHEGFKAFFS